MNLFKRITNIFNFCKIKIPNFCKRKPDVILKKHDGSIYLRRWWIIPRNRFGFNIYLHNFLSSDEDRALHDHPWWNISILLSGSYIEHLPKDINKWIKGDRTEITKIRYPFIPIFRSSESIHKIELINNKTIWTLFITGPVVREWGFYCNDFWKHNKEFIKDNGCE